MSDDSYRYVVDQLTSKIIEIEKLRNELEELKKDYYNSETDLEDWKEIAKGRGESLDDIIKIVRTYAFDASATLSDLIKYLTGKGLL